MATNHEWSLKGGGFAKNSSTIGMGVSLWQCEACGLAATRALTARQESLNAVLPVPDVDEPCGVDDGD